MGKDKIDITWIQYNLQSPIQLLNLKSFVPVYFVRGLVDPATFCVMRV